METRPKTINIEESGFFLLCNVENNINNPKIFEVILNELPF